MVAGFHQVVHRELRARAGREHAAFKTMTGEVAGKAEQLGVFFHDARDGLIV
jgi:rRNA pseudouridine-1189 N-methylase Emg1 (Nep1/Mra1 family)